MKLPRAASLVTLLACLALPACGDDDLPPPIETGGAGVPAGLTAEQWGSFLFSDHGCSACHLVNGNRLVGGPLDRLWGRERALEGGGSATVDEAYLRRSILDPDAEVVAGYPSSMPSYRGLLGETELEALVAFLRQLR